MPTRIGIVFIANFSRFLETSFFLLVLIFRTEGTPPFPPGSRNADVRDAHRVRRAATAMENRIPLRRTGRTKLTGVDINGVSMF